MFAELQETPSSVRYPWGSKMKDVLWDTTVGYYSEEPGRNGYWKVLVGYLLDTCWILVFLDIFFGMIRNDLPFCGTWKPTVTSEAMSVAIDSLSAALLWTANETGRVLVEQCPKWHLLWWTDGTSANLVLSPFPSWPRCAELGAAKKRPGEDLKRITCPRSWRFIFEAKAAFSRSFGEDLERRSILEVFSRWLCLKLGS